tara:strand:+ start:114 stop:425 length:312 start_codon:yes stop_codon:yes gene_type:complete
MSNQKFTSGKWHAVISNDECNVITGKDGSQITDLAESEINEVEQDANAHLIAAAPAMYLEIKSEIYLLKATMENSIFDEAATESFLMLIKRKEKLLAKARGEQ